MPRKEGNHRRHMDIQAYVINLKDSAQRREAVAASARKAGVAVRFVEAVDGRALALGEWRGFDRTGFILRHGRTPLGAEYGCYMSHLRALDRIVADGADYAVIAEDDVVFLDGFAERLAAIAQAAPTNAVVKLMNHRTKGFLEKVRTGAGDSVGRCMHGPNGSAIAYLLTPGAAAALRAGLLPMRLPYDIALERDWNHGVRVLTVRDALVAPSPQTPSTIHVPNDGYRATKLFVPLRLPAAIFRGYDYAMRSAYAVLR